ncbi:hypothetical protein MIMGU_mgv11b020821mg [Erythranthe guttata]|uniref:Uncharacterized protein n=1 Tax=Erythranthe guttata TaxID=4155 RepID=A0A022QFY2_ERYGU|nr:hypothetical protein MIMGU_mgv11b020821mg [Erythranthe guttata]
MEISFKGNTLRLPMLFVDVETKLELLNLIAFERFDTNAGRLEGVSLMRSSGIIRNGHGSDKDVTGLYKLLSTDTVADTKSGLDVVYTKVGRKLRSNFRKRLHQ